MVSGLGADDLVLQKIVFPEGIEPVFIPWLMPEKEENLEHYAQRMAESIDSSEPFCLLGYSFGGILVQEIHRIKPAQKIIILGSVKSPLEYSHLINIGRRFQLPKRLPLRFFNEKSTLAYSFVRKIFDPKNPKLLQYFRVKDPYYLKWSMHQIVNWKNKPINVPIYQIMGDCDIVFPIAKCQPDYIIKGGTHLFPVTKSKELSKILSKIL